MTQWYHALDWLQPLPGAPALQHQAWSQLEEKLGTLGGRPPVASVPHSSVPSVCAALARLNLRFKAGPNVGSQSVAAILESDGSGAPLVLALKLHRYMRNQPSR